MGTFYIRPEPQEDSWPGQKPFFKGRLLNKKRKLSIAHIRRLTEYLKIPADVLIKDYELAS